MAQHTELVKICDVCEKRVVGVPSGFGTIPIILGYSDSFLGWFELKQLNHTLKGTTKKIIPKDYDICSTECLMDLADKLHQERRQINEQPK